MVALEQQQVLFYSFGIHRQMTSLRTIEYMNLMKTFIQQGIIIDACSRKEGST